MATLEFPPELEQEFRRIFGDRTELRAGQDGKPVDLQIQSGEQDGAENHG